MSKQPSINLTETGNLLKNNQTNLKIPCIGCVFQDICKYKDNIGPISASRNFVIHVECKEQKRLNSLFAPIK